MQLAKKNKKKQHYFEVSQSNKKKVQDQFKLFYFVLKRYYDFD